MGLLNLLGGNKFNEGLEKANNTKGAIVLDVRSAEEYKQGHVPGSINIPLNTLPKAELKKDAVIYVYCQSGSRSSRAEKYLKSQGFEVYNLGGIVSYKGSLKK